MLQAEQIVSTFIFIKLILSAQGYVRQHSNEENIPPSQNGNNSGNIVLNFEANSNMGGIQNESNQPPAQNQHNPRPDPNNSYILRGRNNAEDLEASNNNDMTQHNVEMENQVIQSILKEFLFSSLRWNIVSFCVLGFVILCLQLKLSYVYPIAFLWAYDVYSIIVLMLNPHPGGTK